MVTPQEQISNFHDLNLKDYRTISEKKKRKFSFSKENSQTNGHSDVYILVKFPCENENSDSPLNKFAP